ncbi:hypothetical protein K474DRAFT_882845 [Panus rudis PR-1116 ss-1]|nr:hypothetical protein K474DRAFT_882845 [Panus rudis PR-1116 ss-1]
MKRGEPNQSYLLPLPIELSIPVQTAHCPVLFTVVRRPVSVGAQGRLLVYCAQEARIYSLSTLLVSGSEEASIDALSPFVSSPQEAGVDTLGAFVGCPQEACIDSLSSLFVCCAEEARVNALSTLLSFMRGLEECRVFAREFDVCYNRGVNSQTPYND